MEVIVDVKLIKEVAMDLSKDPHTKKHDDGNDIFFKWLSNGSSKTATMFYFPCIIVYFISISQRVSIILCIAFFIILFFDYIAMIRKKFKELENKKQK